MYIDSRLMRFATLTTFLGKGKSSRVTRSHKSEDHRRPRLRFCHSLLTTHHSLLPDPSAHGDLGLGKDAAQDLDLALVGHAALVQTAQSAHDLY